MGIGSFPVTRSKAEKWDAFFSDYTFPVRGAKGRQTGCMYVKTASLRPIWHGNGAFRCLQVLADGIGCVSSADFAEQLLFDVSPFPSIEQRKGLFVQQVQLLQRGLTAFD